MKKAGSRLGNARIRTVVKMMVPKKVIAFVFLLFSGLAFLLVRENEGKTAVETKLNNIQYKADSLNIEKESVIADLQMQVSGLEAKLKEAEEKYGAFVAEKNSETDKMKAEARETEAKHEETLKAKNSEIGATQLKLKEESEKFGERLKEKNSEMSGLASQLKDISGKLDETLRKRDALESQNLACEQRIASLENDLQVLRRHNKKLLETLEQKEKQGAVLD